MQERVELLMAKEFSKRFYASNQWKQCRQSYIQSVNGLCERCLKDGKLTAGLELHHIKELTPNNISDSNITLNWDNLILLCHDCHDKEHKRYQRAETIRDGLVFTEDGQLIKVE